MVNLVYSLTLTSLTLLSSTTGDGCYGCRGVFTNYFLALQSDTHASSLGSRDDDEQTLFWKKRVSRLGSFAFVCLLLFLSFLLVLFVVDFLKNLSVEQ